MRMLERDPQERVFCPAGGIVTMPPAFVYAETPAYCAKRRQAIAACAQQQWFIAILSE
jgi:hypothetical protein